MLDFSNAKNPYVMRVTHGAKRRYVSDVENDVAHCKRIEIKTNQLLGFLVIVCRKAEQSRVEVVWCIDGEYTMIKMMR
ncbi:hypothetical protein [Enterovibrio norvegicus]|uniref:Uncharacterized protein n=1 Tax=Enterovibrio norvegicus DSM 15893 TaxID=1121869 RepID=A0A1I5LCP4_9GAMM|nr:hypothetical protein [Enterovibrio norvegicus]SFO95018.1 hypothetical protein SAMN03084138_00930 [Enterovibrio norvegicus DSM 15893]